ATTLGGLRFARPEKVRPVGLAEQTKEECRVVFRKHVVRETDSPNRWTLQQTLQQLCVLLILRLRSLHALSVEAQLADHFGLGLHSIDFDAQHFFRTTRSAPATLFAEDLCRCPEGEKRSLGGDPPRLLWLAFISCGTCGIQPARSSY